MNLARLGVTRPVTGFMVLVSTIVLGALSAVRLPLEFYPRLSIPFVAGSTQWSGLNRSGVTVPPTFSTYRVDQRATGPRTTQRTPE